ncbi:DUF1338 family protein [Sandaracinobacter neustonicus]|uniref:2-oxoadipate dioxygenase/decarboxylase n=1 Tax=Sandaracinobacter neustonicus TaxID=1715348 RepID=A0A501XN01_9SPHN|nr:DUF1338 family protein [Sandaracinobacter neustonicus]TPE61839.1 DUF1338 family protein [Sandaracinobacter neustonicus]
MRSMNEGMVEHLVRSVLGDTAALTALDVHADLLAEADGPVSRAAFAMALAVLLSDDLLKRVPSGADYARREAASGRRILFDHGALRTILFADGATGALPAGQLAFARILEPLGYQKANTYPLPRLKMTGHAYAHSDLPEAIPQYFVSELHVDRFDADFAEAAARVFGSSRDPLGQTEQALLSAMAQAGEAPLELALAALPGIAAAFARQHGPVALGDYEILLAQSAEAGWIATEGNSFNHVTDRVAHVESLADSLRAEGFPIKDRVEVAREGRVRQTALKADRVERSFTTAEGEISRRVPGSFYEFISREIDPATGCIDLSFDSSNATGIFAMTRAA